MRKQTGKKDVNVKVEEREKENIQRIQSHISSGLNEEEWQEPKRKEERKKEKE